MAATTATKPELLESVPRELRGRIVSGMRWTLWISVLAVPFSYGSTILLARVGPKVIGTYGLVMVYRMLVACVFYLGGDPVVIRFIPELRGEKRISFLASYFLVILAALVPWLVAASFWPSKLKYLFGAHAGTLMVFFLYLSPVYILFSLAIAALQSDLEMRWAELVMRVVTVGSFLMYAALYFFFRPLLEADYTGLIWGSFFVLAAAGFALGMWRLLRLESWRCRIRSLRFFLPRGFWRYTLSLQETSALSALTNRLDYIVILNFGGLFMLGEYVAIAELGQALWRANKYFVATLLPALTNLGASEGTKAASEVFSMHLRLLFAVDMAGTCALMFLVKPLILLLGPKYISLDHLFIIMVLFYGLAGPGSIGGMLLTSVGKQQHAVWVRLVQTGLFVLLFFTLWPHWRLLGAVLAYAISHFAANAAYLPVAQHSTRVRFSALKDYAWFVLVGSLAALLAARVESHWVFAAVPACGFAVLVYLWVAGYRYAECRQLLHCLLPLPSRAPANWRTKPDRGEM